MHLEELQSCDVISKLIKSPGKCFLTTAKREREAFVFEWGFVVVGLFCFILAPDLWLENDLFSKEGVWILLCLNVYHT